MSNEDEYEVDRIVGCQRVEGEMYYLIEWTGYQPEDNTWEAEENLMGNKGLIADFKEAYSKQHPHTKFHGDRSVGVRRLVLQGVYDPDTKRHSPTFEQKSRPKSSRRTNGQMPSNGLCTSTSSASASMSGASKRDRANTSTAKKNSSRSGTIQSTKIANLLKRSLPLPSANHTIVPISPTSTISSSPPILTPSWDDNQPSMILMEADHDSEQHRKHRRTLKTPPTSSDTHPSYITNPPIFGHLSISQVIEDKRELDYMQSSMEHSVQLAKSQGHELIFDQHGNMTFKNVTPKVTVVNEIDDTSFPEQFVFIDKLVFSKRVSVPDPDFLIGCECQHSCLKTNNEECHEEWTYDSRGKLKPGCTGPLYECNLACQCKASCPNRVVQRGRTVALEIFQTKSKGWGVRCKTKIMANSFVEEYLGEVITEAQGEARGTIYDRIGVSYLFDMDSAVTEGTTAKYVIDSYVCGNASHFFNHSCNPNLTVFGVYHDSGDPYFHRLAFFALRDIEAGEELTFDYLGSHGLLPSNTHAQQRIECLCDDNACRGFIHS